MHGDTDRDDSSEQANRDDGLGPIIELARLRLTSGQSRTDGLPDEVVVRFAERDPRILEALRRAAAEKRGLSASAQKLVEQAEATTCEELQRDYVSFYGADASSPYLPLAASGPWVVTAHGAVLHDSGGYGMLGLGHAPSAVVEAMAKPWVMANIMTPSFSQDRFAGRLKREIGHTRGGCPFDRFVCLFPTVPREPQEVGHPTPTQGLIQHGRGAYQRGKTQRRRESDDT